MIVFQIVFHAQEEQVAQVVLTSLFLLMEAVSPVDQMMESSRILMELARIAKQAVSVVIQKPIALLVIQLIITFCTQIISVTYVILLMAIFSTLQIYNVKIVERDACNVIAPLSALCVTLQITTF